MNHPTDSYTRQNITLVWFRPPTKSMLRALILTFPLKLQHQCLQRQLLEKILRIPAGCTRTQIIGPMFGLFDVGSTTGTVIERDFELEGVCDGNRE